MTTIQDEYAKLQRSERNRRNAKQGNKAEDIAAKALIAAGYVCVEPIERSWIIRWGYDPKTKQKKVVGAIPKKKVSGDLIGIEPGTGRAVHVECKNRPEGNLMWSAFEPHQIDALNRKTAYGVICYIAWVRFGECVLYRWPVQGFGPGMSLKWPK